MAVVSGRRDEEGTSAAYLDEEGSEHRPVEFAQSGSSLHQMCINSAWDTTDRCRLLHSEERIPVMFTWSHGAEKVAITGSWDKWQILEPLQRSSKDFILIKMLPSAIYQYRFIVDGHLRCAPDLLCDLNDHGGAYNIMDVNVDSFPTQWFLEKYVTVILYKPSW